MKGRPLAVAAAALLAGAALLTDTAASGPDDGAPSAAPALPLPAPGPLAVKQRETRGPRVSGGHIRGRELTFWGAAGVGRRVLVAGCVNGRRCAGEQVVRWAGLGCPPDDADLWFARTLLPRGRDLDASPASPGAAAWRQAVADLRPHHAIVFRTGPRAVVRAAGPSAVTAATFARRARLPFEEQERAGLASWTTTALPSARALTVELPAGRIDPRVASRVAWALHRLAGTRFAAGALEERLRLIRFGHGPEGRLGVASPRG